MRLTVKCTSWAQIPSSPSQREEASSSPGQALGIPSASGFLPGAVMKSVQQELPGGKTCTQRSENQPEFGVRPADKLSTAQHRLRPPSPQPPAPGAGQPDPPRSPPASGDLLPGSSSWWTGEREPYPLPRQRSGQMRVKGGARVLAPSFEKARNQPRNPFCTSLRRLLLAVPGRSVGGAGREIGDSRRASRRPLGAQAGPRASNPAGRRALLRAGPRKRPDELPRTWACAPGSPALPRSGRRALVRGVPGEACAYLQAAWPRWGAAEGKREWRF